MNGRLDRAAGGRCAGRRRVPRCPTCERRPVAGSRRIILMPVQNEPKRQPPLAGVVDDQVRVDRVVVDRASLLDDQALVGPRPGRAGRAGGQEDRRALRAERRGRVVQVVLAVVVRDVRRPQVAAAIGVACVVHGAPLGQTAPGVAPGDPVGGGLERHVVAGRGEDVAAVGRLDHGRVVRTGGAGDPAGVRVRRGVAVGGRRGRRSAAVARRR